MQTILYWSHTKWLVHALTVMPTHVHVLATPLESARGEWYSLSEILHSIERASARSINLARGVQGPVWSTESYDRIIRSEREWSATFDYILHNAMDDGYEGDPYAYDGFWCEGMEAPPGEHGGPPMAEHPADERSTGGVMPRISAGSFVQRRRYLPHWESPGASYHVVFGLRGHRASPDLPEQILGRRMRGPIP